MVIEPYKRFNVQFMPKLLQSGKNQSFKSDYPVSFLRRIYYFFYSASQFIHLEVFSEIRQSTA